MEPTKDARIGKWPADSLTAKGDGNEEQVRPTGVPAVRLANLAAGQHARLSA